MKRFSQPGFTLVELIIVIAIGGLIVTLAFYGISQGQREKRDDARRSDASHYLLAAKQWASENNGILPANPAYAAAVVTTYITAGSASFNDPDGSPWVIKFATAAMLPVTPDANPDMWVASGATCDYGTPAGIAAGGARQFAVAVALEAGGSYCVSN